MAKEKKHIDRRSQLLKQYLHTGATRQATDRDQVFERLMDRISEANENDPKIRKLSVPEPRKKYRFIPPHLLKYASVFILLTVSTYYLIKGLHSDYVKGEMVEVTNQLIHKINPPGRMSTHVLSDGTIIKLNAESQLEYPKYFDDKVREVKLIGEAWFEVAEDAQRPFIITSGKLQTKVLGTKFNIKAYPEDDNIEVALLDGKVEVNLPENDKGQNVILEPKEMLVFSRIEQQWHSEIFDPITKLAWAEGVIIFEEASIDEVVSRLERWYGVKIFVKNGENINTRIKSTHFNQPLNRVLDGLGFGSNFGWYFADKEHKVIVIEFKI